jgi:hypothetical protein
MIIKKSLYFCGVTAGILFESPKHWPALSMTEKQPVAEASCLCYDNNINVAASNGAIMYYGRVKR